MMFLEKIPNWTVEDSWPCQASKAFFFPVTHVSAVPQCRIAALRIIDISAECLTSNIFVKTSYKKNIHKAID